MLFLLTVERTAFIGKLVDEMRMVDVITQKFDTLMAALLSGQSMAKEAMVDLLKLTCNILHQYPRLGDKGKGKENLLNTMGELWSDKLDRYVLSSCGLIIAEPRRFSLLPPLLRLFNELPPTFPSPLAAPLTHVIHGLIMIPVAPLASRWFTPNSSPTSTPRSSPPEKLHKAISALTSGRRSLSSSRSSSPASSSTVPRDTVQRAWDLLELTTAHYLPGDPDDIAVRTMCTKEGVVLDEILPPLIVLLIHFAADDASARLRMKEWLLPADL